MGRKKIVDRVIEEYIPKKRCKTEGCKNRKAVDKVYCLSCFYTLNKKGKKNKDNK